LGRVVLKQLLSNANADVPYGASIADLRIPTQTLHKPTLQNTHNTNQPTTHPRRTHDPTQQVRNEKARRFLASMRRKPGVPFEQLFPKADPRARALLRKLLAFDPADRPSAGAWFDQIGFGLVFGCGVLLM